MYLFEFDDVIGKCYPFFFDKGLKIGVKFPGQGIFNYAYLYVRFEARY